MVDWGDSLVDHCVKWSLESGTVLPWMLDREMGCREISPRPTHLGVLRAVVCIARCGLPAWSERCVRAFEANPLRYRGG